MHNCKATRERVTELLLNSVDVRPAELLECSECSDEFDSIKETLRITKRQIEATVPSESYWNQYHERLQRRLNVQIDDQVVIPSATARASWLSRIFTSSIRVPVPVAAAVLLVVGVSLLFGSRASQKILPTQTVSVVHVPVEVPVIQEKVVTRVVYRKAKHRTPAPGSTQVDDSTVAKSQKVNLPSLVGFKPLDDVKLTVIKGGSQDEK